MQIILFFFFIARGTTALSTYSRTLSLLDAVPISGERHSCRQRYGRSTVAAHRRLVPGITIASIQRKARKGGRKVVQLVGYVCKERLALVAIKRVGQ